MSFSDCFLQPVWPSQITLWPKWNRRMETFHTLSTWPKINKNCNFLITFSIFTISFGAWFTPGCLQTKSRSTLLTGLISPFLFREYFKIRWSRKLWLRIKFASTEVKNKRLISHQNPLKPDCSFFFCLNLNFSTKSQLYHELDLLWHEKD